MARSRSSFELTSAIATAASLVEETKTTEPLPAIVPQPSPAWVSFRGAGVDTVVPVPVHDGASGSLRDRPPHAPVHDGASGSLRDPPPHTPVHDGASGSLRDPPPHTPAAATPAMPPPAPAALVAVHVPPPPPSADPVSQTLDSLDASEAAGTKRPPKLPDLSTVVSPVTRCERIVEWIAEATGGTGVFIADADGLPVAGDIRNAEARIAAAGLTASSVTTLAQALPGSPSPLFVLHVGEGPFFQLIGFQAARGTYVVGLMRSSPLTPRQAHAIRLACRHAFNEPLVGAP